MNKPNFTTAVFAFGFAAVLSVSGCAATDQALGQAVPAAIEGQRGQVHEWAIDNNAAAILSLRVGDPRINTGDENGYSPLHWAATLGNADAVDALLVRGADVDARSMCDSSEISNAAMSIFFDKGFYSREELEGVTITNSCGTILHFAASSNNRRVITAVLDAGADVYDRNNRGDNAVHYAAWENADKSVYELAAHGVGLDARNDKGKTPMHEAANFGAVDVIDELAIGGADINARDADAATPMHWAVFEAQPEAMVALFKRGADIEARSVDGYTPLHWAVANRNYEAVGMLVRARADVNARTDKSHTVLHLAADNNDAEAIEALCNLKDNRANADIWDVDGHTPLHFAAAKNFTESIRVLVGACKADVNSENRFSQTPLDLAVDEDNQAAIEELLTHNAQRGPKS